MWERGEWKSWLKTQHSENKDHGIWSHHFMANRMGKQWKQWETLFSCAPKSLQIMTAALKLKDPYTLEEKPRQHIKKQRHYFANKSLSSQSYGFSSGHVWMSEKVMAPHSSPLTWKIPWTEEPGRLQSMGLLRVGHNWATSLSLFAFMHWRRKWQSTPVFLPGESQGWGSLVGCHLWGRTELDTTEAT